MRPGQNGGWEFYERSLPFLMHLDAQQRVERAAPATINRRLVALNRFFQSTMARHLLPANPTDDNSAPTLRQTFAARYLAANPDDLRGLARLLGHAV